MTAEPASKHELMQLLAKVHPQLNRHDRRVEALRLMRQARRQLREQARSGGGEGTR